MALQQMPDDLIKQMLDQQVASLKLDDMFLRPIPATTLVEFRYRRDAADAKFEVVRHGMEKVVRDYAEVSYQTALKHDWRLANRTPRRNEGRRISRKAWQRANGKKMRHNRKLRMYAMEVMARFQEDAMKKVWEFPTPVPVRSSSTCKCRGIVCLCMAGMT